MPPGPLIFHEGKRSGQDSFDADVTVDASPGSTTPRRKQANIRSDIGGSNQYECGHNIIVDVIGKVGKKVSGWRVGKTLHNDCKQLLQ